VFRLELKLGRQALVRPRHTTSLTMIAAVRFTFLPADLWTLCNANQFAIQWTNVSSGMLKAEKLCCVSFAMKQQSGEVETRAKGGQTQNLEPTGNTNNVDTLGGSIRGGQTNHGLSARVTHCQRDTQDFASISCSNYGILLGGSSK
jgi:hypothetical protein